MGVWRSYCRNVAEGETKKSLKPSLSLDTPKTKNVDIDTLFKIIASWLVGGIISLIPTFTYIIYTSSQKDLWSVLEQFFANKDLYLVVTTLTVGAMFELIFSAKNGISKYGIVSIGIILIVLSIHLFSLLQQNIVLPNMPSIGVILLAACIINSVSGYYIVCRKKDGEKNE